MNAACLVFMEGHTHCLMPLSSVLPVTALSNLQFMYGASVELSCQLRRIDAEIRSQIPCNAHWMSIEIDCMKSAKKMLLPWTQRVATS